MRTLKEKTQSRAKSQNLQDFWKELVSTMNNEEVIDLFVRKKKEQSEILDFSFTMTLSQVITIIKRELNDRNIDYRAIQA